ncbi:DedA family protein [Brevibacillus daliensis]|uniref:DedA family protein n=1 Tax=Brevibacillus daliensis TaxID=2892995 RepID=UPI001E2C3760|nr:DedA family protein [Brevibacillus daliensis]
MNIDILVPVIEQYGYAALFFMLWLGIVGLPVPDELVVASGGLVAALGYLDPVLAFVVDYLGVVSGLSIGFFLGRFIGPPILARLAKKKKLGPYIERSSALINRYGTYSICISYLLPVVRHVVPYVVAVGGMKFRTYALFAYPTGFVWTLAFYSAGYFFGNHISTIIDLSRRYGFILLGIVVAAIVVIIILRYFKSQKKKL